MLRENLFTESQEENSFLHPKYNLQLVYRGPSGDNRTDSLKYKTLNFN